jgi:hypothetical protein
MTEPAAASSASEPDAPGTITDAELRELGARTRSGDDPLVRRLLTSYLTLRRVTADLVAFIEAREGGAAVAGEPALLRARQLADAPRR